MSIETHDPPHTLVNLDNLDFLAVVAGYYEDNVASLPELLGDSIDIPNFAKSALVSWIDEQRDMYYYYDLRRASSVSDLRIYGFGENLGNYVDYDLRHDDAFVLFMRDGLGGWVKRYTVVIDFDGDIPYSKEFFHGPMASGGNIGDGEVVRECDAGTARTIVRNMMWNAAQVADIGLLTSSDSRLSSFALEMVHHTI